MVAKTRKRKHYTQSKKRGIILNRRKASKKVREMIEKSNDSKYEYVWGKNKPLEKFWQGLASGKYVVVIYKDGKYKYIDLPNPNTQKSKTLFNDFDEDKEIAAVLSSSRSTDTYETDLYPKVKDKSVEYVIQNYKKFFEFMGPNKNASEPLMKKVMLPS